MLANFEMTTVRARIDEPTYKVCSALIWIPIVCVYIFSDLPEPFGSSDWAWFAIFWVGFFAQGMFDWICGYETPWIWVVPAVIFALVMPTIFLIKWILLILLFLLRYLLSL